jgi:hypothetical protein
MIVKCIANNRKDLPLDFLRPKSGFGIDYSFPLIINKYYIVYGMILFDNYICYYIEDENHPYYPVWSPSPLFEVVNGQLSKYWVYSFIQEKIIDKIDIRTMWGYPEWANDPYYYELLFDGEEKQVNIYRSYKRLMDVEFPIPWIEDKAEAMDDHWLFCSYCIDAWQSFSTDGMVICPTCNRTMHNPNYINPLKNLNFLE